MLPAIISKHKKGELIGAPSLCTANRLILDIAMAYCKEKELPLLVEATCNQVNQFGGYTGLTPEGFFKEILELSNRHCFDREKLILGGDHLGPNPWKHLDSNEAMQNAEDMIRQYAASGYTKIHVDCSMSCADDPTPLGVDEQVRRAARLIKAVESSVVDRQLCYVIGTEVPVPGGETDNIQKCEVSTISSVEETLAAQKKAIQELCSNSEDIWRRIIAMVTQPGVEFDHSAVRRYNPREAVELSRYSESLEYMVWEAHSTDYQSEDALRQLVCDHFAILKVGPALTFSLREALFSLAAIESELIETNQRSRLVDTLEQVMLESPESWAPYYKGSDREVRVLRKYSLSDRCRYYWPEEKLQRSVDVLLKNLSDCVIPLGLVSQYFPGELALVERGEIALTPANLIGAHVRMVLEKYYASCGLLDDE